MVDGQEEEESERERVIIMPNSWSHVIGSDREKRSVLKKETQIHPALRAGRRVNGRMEREREARKKTQLRASERVCVC